VANELSDAEIRILLLEGEHLFFELADRYPVQAVCWETWRSDPSLAGASRQVQCALMGGINPTTFVSGSVNDIRGQIADAVAQTGGWRFMLSPSGSLSPDARPELLASVRALIQG
jgi:uroporphyrinogen-III decarboxylase